MQKSISILTFLFTLFILNQNTLFAQDKEESLALLGRDFIMALEQNDMSLIESFFPSNKDIEATLEDATERSEAENSIEEQGGIDMIITEIHEEFENEFAAICEDLSQNYANRNELLDNARFESEIKSDHEFKTLQVGNLAIITEDFVIEVEAIYLTEERGWVLTRFYF